MSSTNTDKVYILKKDLPDAKAGREFVHNKTYNRYYLEGNVLGSYWDAEWVENNPEWFELKQPAEDKRIEITHFNKHDTLIGNKIDSFFYQFCASKQIPSEKYEAVKKAIERELNGEPISVKESAHKDWEVISMKGPFGIRTKKEDGLYYFDSLTNKTGYPFEDLYDKTSFVIHSVRRKSDGEVFTVGDKLIDMEGDDTISSFVLNYKGNELWVQTNDKKKYGCAIEIAKKQPKEEPKPLFLTEDGVDVYDGDKIHVLVDDTGMSIATTAREDDHLGGVICNYYKVFSNQISAKEYALNNSPCLSVNETIDLIRRYCDGAFSIDPQDWDLPRKASEIITPILELAKSKINK